MNDYDFIKIILNNRYQSKNQELLQEDKYAPGKVTQKVRIKDGAGITAYCLYEFVKESNNKLLPFFNSNNTNSPKELLKFCDYIMLVEFRGKLYILLIELKRGSTQGARDQIEAAHLLMKYILNSAERIKNANNVTTFDSTKVEFRRIILQPIKKEPLNPNKQKFNNIHDFIYYETGADFDIRRVITP